MIFLHHSRGREHTHTHTHGQLSHTFIQNKSKTSKLCTINVFSCEKQLSSSWPVHYRSGCVCMCLRLYYECYANWVLSAVHAEVDVRNLTSVCRVIQLMLASQQLQQVVMCCCFCLKETFQRLCSTHGWCQHMEVRNNEWCVCSRSV